MRNINQLQDQDQSGFLSIEQIELKGFSRSIAEIEWLLLLLVVMYYVAPGSEVFHSFGLIMSMACFGIFSLSFKYLNFNSTQYLWKLVLETWVMIVFITFVLWRTGGVYSPLVNLYFLVIISSAITLGKLVTFLEIALIGAFYFFLSVNSPTGFSFIEFTETVIYFSQLVLIAYFTTMLVSDVNYGRKMFKALSETDDMTNLLNKRSFKPMFEKEAELALTYNHPLSVMMVDADNLKTINDKYGHKAGDKLITTIAAAIKECLRSNDIICRYGGDEFVALLPKAPLSRALEIGERLRSSIENTSFDVKGTRISSTVSIGIATYPGKVNEVSELLERADQALYASKNSGRNSVRSFDGTEKLKALELILGFEKSVLTRKLKTSSG